MNKFLDFIVPRFITEDVVCVEGKGGKLHILYPVEYAEPDDEADYIVKVRCFTFLGLGLFPKVVGKPVKWERT